MKLLLLLASSAIVGVVGATILELVLGINYEGVSALSELTHKAVIVLWGGGTVLLAVLMRKRS